MIEDVNLDEGKVAVDFDGRTVAFVFGELDTLVPAYAATIHKNQGAEYPAVVIPVMTQHYAMPHRNLVYTGVTVLCKPRDHRMQLDRAGTGRFADPAP